MAAIDVARILRMCRPRDRILLEQQMSGLTAEEIAQKQGVTKTAIRIRLMRARRAARIRVERPSRQEQKRLAGGKTYEPETFIEHRNWVEA